VRVILTLIQGPIPEGSPKSMAIFLFLLVIFLLMFLTDYV